jgi:FkbM family methyltransferase
MATKKISKYIKNILIKVNLISRFYYFFKLKKYVEILTKRERGIFIDCGAYDGCSAIKFMMMNPGFDSISFEPNPEMWGYFESVPTTLIKKGVSKKKEVLDFLIDHIDGDGSSTIAAKTILYGKPEENKNCKRIRIECVGILDLVTNLSKKYDKIILKLDVEGSEYDILEELLKQNLIEKISKLYAEFHWNKCDIPESRHKKLLDALKGRLEVLEWDGIDFAIHKRGGEKKLWRTKLVASKFKNLTEYQNIQVEIV